MKGVNGIERITPAELYEQLDLENDWPKDNLCDPPISEHAALQILLNELLEDDWYIDISEGPSQVLTAQVATILERHQRPLNKFMTKHFGIL